MRLAGDLYAACLSKSLRAFAIRSSSKFISGFCRQGCCRVIIQRRQKCTRASAHSQTHTPRETPERPPEPAPETPLPASPPPALTFAVAQFAPRESHVCAVVCAVIFPFNFFIVSSGCKLCRLHRDWPAHSCRHRSSPEAQASSPQGLIVPFGGGSLRSYRGLLFHATGNVQIRSQRNFGPCHCNPRWPSPACPCFKPNAQELSLSYRDARLLGFFSSFLFLPAVVRRAKKAAIVFIFIAFSFSSDVFLDFPFCQLLAQVTLFNFNHLRFGFLSLIPIASTKFGNWVWKHEIRLISELGNCLHWVKPRGVLS